MWSGNLPGGVRETIVAASSDAIQLEQYMDFVRNRTFRQTLLCHDSIRPNRQLTADRMEGFFVASPLRPTRGAVELSSPSPETFANPATGQSMTTTDPIIKSALILLGEAWPGGILFDDLFRQACEKLRVGLVQDTAAVKQARESLAGTLLQCFAAGHAELHTVRLPFVCEVGSRPRASALARHQARSGAVVTTRRHETAQLSSLSRQVLPLLDGTRSHEELVVELERMVERGALVVQEKHQREQQGAVRDRRPALAAALADQLRQLARMALLEA
jgi:methyltransferase-like protein